MFCPEHSNFRRETVSYNKDHAPKIITKLFKSKLFNYYQIIQTIYQMTKLLIQLPITKLLHIYQITKN